MPPNPFGNADLITLKKHVTENFGICTAEILENWAMLAAVPILPLALGYKNSNNKKGMSFCLLATLTQ